MLLGTRCPQIVSPVLLPVSTSVDEHGRRHIPSGVGVNTTFESCVEIVDTTSVNSEREGSIEDGVKSWRTFEIP